MGRKIIAVLAGMFAAGFVVLAVEALAQQLIVPQRGGAPTTAMLGFIALAWLLGSFAATFITQRIDRSRRPLPALLTGGILLGLALANLLALPHPLWFRVLGTLVFLPGTVFGIFFARRRTRVTHRAAA